LAVAETDFELLAAWRTGDRARGNELFQRHFACVSRFFRNKIDGPVDDLVQEVFLVCVEGRDRFEGRSKFRTYVLGIANNLLRAHYRRKTGGNNHTELASVADLGCSAGSIIARGQDEQLLLRALRHVSLDQQTLLELYYWEELSGPELADVLKIPHHTARSRLSRAREALRDAFARVASTADLARSSIEHLEGLAAGVWRART